MVPQIEGGTWVKVFGNRVLRKIFPPKTEGIIGDWRKPRNEELYDLYSSTNIIPLIK